MIESFYVYAHTTIEMQCRNWPMIIYY